MKKVLIVRLSSMGDIIFHIPLANLFKSQGYEIGWLVSEKGYDLLKGNPCVDKVFLAPVQKWKKRGPSLKSFLEYLEILKEIRKEKYDIAIDAQMMFKSMYWMIFSGAKRRVCSTNAKEFSQIGANEIIPDIYRRNERHVVLNSFEFAKHLGLKTDEIKFTLPQTSDEIKKQLDELLKDVDHTKPLVVIAPATTRELKYWDKDNWKTVVNELEKNCSLIFTGTEADRELLSYIGADRHTNLCGKTNLEGLRELFSRVDLVMAPDSGSAHLAWASRKPAVIAIFTCTPPKLFGPFGDDNKYVAINGGLSCQPCDQRGCHQTGENYKICTRLPEPEKILNIVKNLLKNNTAPK